MYVKIFKNNLLMEIYDVSDRKGILVRLDGGTEASQEMP